MFAGRALAVLAAGLIVAAAVSCRVPATKLASNPAAVQIYDPQTSDAIAKAFPQSPQQVAETARLRTALAPPVSVIGWEPSHAKCRVFFATNRTPLKKSPAGQIADSDSPVYFAQAWGDVLSVGTCDVTLPKRVRGKDVAAVGSLPKASPVKLAKWMPDWATPKRNKIADAEETTPPPASLAFDPPQTLACPEFFAALRETVERSPERDVLIFVHGFNVDFNSALVRAAQLSLDLPFNGPVVAYSWPSQGGIHHYCDDEEIVARSVEAWVRFIDDLEKNLPRDAKLHIVVHSMGNRLVLAGLSRLPDRFRNPARLGHIALAAPDVDVKDFVRLAPAATATATRTTLYVSDSDTALIASKALHRCAQRIGDAMPPVIVPCVETVDASAIDTSLMGHSYFSTNRSGLSDLFSAIKLNRPAAERAWLSKQTSEAGQWWSFARQPTELRPAWDFEHLAKQPAMTIRK